MSHLSSSLVASSPAMRRSAPLTPALSPQGRGSKRLRGRSRHGVILLVVLGVLVIFALAVLMFVISSRQHKQTTHAAQKVERYDVQHIKQLNQAFYELLVGSRNPSSSTSRHGVLEDMYGNDSLPATPAD